MSSIVKNIRSAVFETNSSSSHSLTISQDELACLPATEKQLRDGKIVITLEGFGWQWERFYRPANKAAYLIVGALSQSQSYSSSEKAPFSDKDQDLAPKVRAANERAARILDILEEQTGCQVLVRGGDCYIDHDSAYVHAAVADDVEELRSFLFSNSSITLGNDNESPSMVETDLGTFESIQKANVYRYG